MISDCALFLCLAFFNNNQSESKQWYIKAYTPICFFFLLESNLKEFFFFLCVPVGLLMIPQ